MLKLFPPRRNRVRAKAVTEEEQQLLKLHSQLLHHDHHHHHNIEVTETGF